MTIDWWTLALQTINFLVLVWLLQRFLYKPIAGIIEKRRNEAREVVREAEKAKAEAEAARKEYDRRTAELAEERRQVLEKAHEEISGERRAAMDEARREADEMIAAAKDSIEKEKAAALKAMRSEITELAGAMAEKLLGEAGFSVPSDVLIKAVCDKIGALPKKERERLDRTLSADGAMVTVVTAQPLSRADKAEWREKLVDALGAEPKTEFKRDGGLIGGAELHFPDAVIRLSWLNELGKIKGSLAQDDQSS